MLDSSTRTPRQPKLRASCNGCGATKLKCDRGQPRCGRCVSLGQECVYAISRKMGKVPRDKMRQNLQASLPRAQAATSERTESSGSGTGGDYRGAGSERADSSLTLDLRPVVTAADSNDHAAAGSDYWLDQFCADRTDAPPPGTIDASRDDDIVPVAVEQFLELGMFDLDQWKKTDHPLSEMMSTNLHNTFMPTPPDLSEYGEYSSSPAGGDGRMHTFGCQATETSSAREGEFAGAQCGGCPIEANRILESVSFASIAHKLRPGSNEATRPPLTPNASCNVPLDAILRINREASECLSRLLACSCAKAPHLVLLYASIISQILIWYQQIAGITPSSSAPRLPAGTHLQLDGPRQSLASPPPPSSSSASSVSAPTSKGHARRDSTAITFQAGHPAHPSTIMSLGSFDIDDTCVQMSLKIQLLIGEIRRAGNLIDQFSLCASSCSNPATGELAMGGVGSLFQSMTSWLRTEHARTDEATKLILWQLNS